jgi:hypothetical protein
LVETGTWSYQNSFHILAKMFVSDARFTHSLYYWKGIYEIYKFTFIWFEKFLTNCSNILGLIFGTSSTTSKNTAPQPWVEESRTELRETFTNSQLIDASIL